MNPIYQDTLHASSILFLLYKDNTLYHLLMHDCYVAKRFLTTTDQLKIVLSQFQLPTSLIIVIKPLSLFIIKTTKKEVWWWRSVKEVCLRVALAIPQGGHCLPIQPQGSNHQTGVDNLAIINATSYDTERC